MQVTAKSTFVHGEYSMRKGESGDMSESSATDLERAGMVTIEVAKKKVAPELENKMEQPHANKGKGK